MTQAVGTGGTATYAYNGDGLKVQRIGPDGTTRYYHDGFRPIWETDGAGVMTAQLDRDIFGNLLSRAEPGSRRYYHTDGLGSTVALTDEAGATAASMLYDAWGNSRATSGTGQGKYRFTGAELDSASGLYHMAVDWPVAERGSGSGQVFRAVHTQFLRIREQQPSLAS